MIINNLRLTIRHLCRQKINTALHVIGLTLGMSVCLLIALLLRYEWSFDRYHHKADRIYRITSQYRDGSLNVQGSSTPLPLAQSLRSGVAGIENVTLAHPFTTAQIEITPGKQFIQKNIVAVDPEILNIFDIEVIAGNGHDALLRPYHALLTETTVKKFFGNEDPLGKTFLFNKKYNITVGGVVRDQPSNTSLPFSILLSFVDNKEFLGVDPDNWLMTPGNVTFVLLPKQPDIRHFEAQLKGIADKNINADPGLPKGIRGDLHLQPLKNIHFEPKYGGGPWVEAVNTTWLGILALTGILVLALACINFVNLSTAQALTRAKEVGVLKSIGASRFQLIGQFLTESCTLALIAGVLSIAVAQLCLPAMNTLLGKSIVFDLFRAPQLMATLLGAVMLTGIFAGLYPAWIIARFNPTANLKPGSAAIQRIGSATLRKVLVVAQFSVSIGLLIAVGLISQQISFIRSKDLGFNKENIIKVPIGNDSQTSAFVAALNQIPQVKQFSFAAAEYWGGMGSLTDGNDPNRVLATTIVADDQFGPAYQLKLLAGRFPASSDTNYVSAFVPGTGHIMKVLVNEKLVKDVGFESTEAAIGKHFWLSIRNHDAEIIGVVSDFNTHSLHRPVTPTVIVQLPKFYKEASIRLEANSNIPQAIASIQTAWKKIYPDQVFEVHFLDQSIDDSYRGETRLYTLFRIFAALAMCISSLGLWGLVTLAAQQRTKEIGIRKVLGASVKAIALLLSKDFLLTVVISLGIAAPLVYYFMQKWLETFAYRIDIGWDVFFIAGMVSIVIALMTVGSRTLKAALANPVDSLRSE
jgi:putative ABC transport system permease protein